MITNQFVVELVSKIHYQNESSYFYELFNLDSRISHDSLVEYIFTASGNKQFANELALIVHDKKLIDKRIKKIYQIIDKYF